MSEMISVTLPDGSRREYPAGTTVLEVAQSIGKKLAKDTVAPAASTIVWWICELRSPPTFLCASSPPETTRLARSSDTRRNT
jgi:hypothetical protein